jgi:hypothetical protein
MVTERLRAQNAEAARQGGRRWGRKPKAPAQPPGWRTGPAWQEMNETTARRKCVTPTVAVFALVGLAVVAVRPELVTDHLPDGGESDVAAAPATKGRLQVLEWASDTGNDECGYGGGFLRPQFTADRIGEPDPSGPAVDPYDRSRELDEGPQECGTVTRT